ncbi:MAG: DUF456 domain-containing protein [Anaerolineae bacterium]|nr:DUF456 domain-containing protein [Anaerolineae bacterium]
MTEFWQGVIIFITLFTMMVGLIFTAVPPIPGTVVIWAAAIFYGLVLGWENLGWLTFGVLTILMIVGLVVDVVAGHFGAKLGGASCLAIFVGAVLGLIVGIILSLIGTPVLGCFAGLIGMVAGVLWIEWKRRGDWERAVRATKGYIAGSVAGIMARVTSGVLMFSIFLVRAYWGG